PRQFIFADGHGGVEKIRIDLEAPHLEHVREALDTNPDANRISVSGAPVVPPPAVRPSDEPVVRPVVLGRPVTVDVGVDLGDDLEGDDDFDELDDPDAL